jgi:hypothetical protein
MCVACAERDGKTIELSDGKRIRMRKAVLMSPSAVDESLGKLSDLVSTFDARLLSSSAADGGDGRAQEWRRSMDTTTLWLTGLRRLLAATANVVKQLLLGTPVPPQRNTRHTRHSTRHTAHTTHATARWCSRGFPFRWWSPIATGASPCRRW